MQLSQKVRRKITPREISSLSVSLLPAQGHTDGGLRNPQIPVNAEIILLSSAPFGRFAG